MSNKMALDALTAAIEAMESCEEGDYSTGHVCHPSFDSDAIDAAIEQARAAIAALQAEPQPIDTAPKDGTEILAWREDCGWFVAKWTCVNDLRTTSDRDRDELDEETLFAFDWFGGDSEGNFRCDGSEVPTRWTHLPPDPLPATPPKD